MNRSLARIHLCMFIFYGLIAAFICGVYLAGNDSNARGTLIVLAMFGVIPTLHLAAMQGVLNGQAWGRWLSRTLGLLLLFAVPFGTIIGTFVLMRTRRKDWEQAP